MYNTEYRTAANLGAKRYYFELTTSPNVIWVNFPAMNLDAGQPVRTIHPDDISLSGNVIGNFRPAQAPF